MTHMRKAVLSSLSLFLILAAFSSSGQQDSAILAEQVAVRRQAAIHEMRIKLSDAIDAQKKGRLEDAAKIYDQIVELFPQTGPSTELIGKEKQEIVAGLASVRLALARDAQKHGNFQDAKRQVDRVLKVDPRNEEARAFARANEKIILGQRGTVPDPETLSRVPDVQKDKIQAQTFAHDGQLLFEMGKLDEASVKLKQAIALDPDNTAAQYFQRLIEEKRYQRATSTHELGERKKIVEIADAWIEPIKRDALPVPNPMARTNLVYTSPGRQQILSKLERIRLTQVSYDSIPLGEVLKLLTDESAQRDPEKTGLNFIIDAHAQVASSAPATSANPADAAAAAAAAAAAGIAADAGSTPVDIGNIPIKLTLRNVSLANVLDAISKVAEPQLTYHIEDYAIVLSPKPTEGQALFSRTFRVDPNTFVQGLESVIALSFANIGGSGSGGSGSGGGGGGSGELDAAFSIPRVTLASIVGGRGGAASTGSGQGLPGVSRTNYTAVVNQVVKDYFRAAGVDLEPPKHVFFNDRLGQLLVRATQQDLETIAAAIETLNAAPPQLTIEAKFAEITQEDSKALGFDWFLGNTLINNGAIGAATGTQPSFVGSPTPANPSGIFPGPGSGSFPGPGTIPQSASDNLLVPGAGRVNSSTPALATITGVLTDPQFRVVIRALEARQGVDLLTAPRVTTLSGRQAQISSLDLVTVVTGVDLEQGNANANTTGTVGNTIVNSAPTLNFTTQPLPFGPVLDVIPYVSADGYSVQMTLIPTITEFLGYDDPGGFIPQASSTVSQGVTLTALLPLPRLRLRQVTTSCNVWDGQTVVLGGLISENINKIKDKIPVLGDLPMVGKLFRSESSTSTKKNLVIFVTPTIIDPAGNRVNRDEDLPFARNSLPAQIEGQPVPPLIK
jgi:general secretion pathway protein D